ncbi:hypothetical protein ACOXXX_13485 [Thalassococcus sp. BH17M4-6]|uniref:hypothetical protein n=1 Tax=Thalassococcus sp. BH17M4-6 TaxID=3413148 RepID=UPI003BE505A0
MKRTIAIAAVALTALTGAASAMTTSANQAILQQYAPNIETSTLSEAQIGSLLAIAYSGDSQSEKRAKIRSFVN